ncbi:MAG: AmmeMemoRadiSam system protein B [Candidatus Obscuribacter sp.]|jgi:AmmeMemoRadiSam system protein B/AmmeMemoRadiSam system protein A|nr:AmmeMemoRadiSam system protein B [Candidatus Obscuribacter sp.]MBK9206384.1 AmmeMemoRadiSam system protein B [Candidatus Obscuribacter sp.]MBK9618284.1 AmmeMemoRadiSam system protein B [Candidatus Obscuribacter sp.]MBK9771148.1 AmmeMemoRadiSam system protein B [Candidatus Obscuribacter sp.]MDQ5966843.1 AmmeMemoRadiSam system protein [Cyanobacteriota bacterium erpe_2018_sw_39hr_WHONDRS-SW48-000098_B_bin.30]
MVIPNQAARYVSILLISALVAALLCSASGAKDGDMFLFGTGNRRPLKFAGTWYQSDPAGLTALIDGYLQEAKASSAATKLKDALAHGQKLLAIVAPHAGYSYSGRTAACSYLAAQDKGIKRVFLLGPTHYKGFRGAGLTSDKCFATVYGDLQIDKAVVADLRDNLLFSDQTLAHHNEHSLELQLAFIKSTLGDVEIVPVLLGHLESETEARLIADAIGRHLRDGDLIVVSSDFTHIGPRFGYEPFKSDFKANLKALDMEAVSYLEKNDLDGFFKFYKKTDDTICGVYALSVLMALLPPQSRGTMLDYRTSQDFHEQEDSSVSYMSILFGSETGWSQLHNKQEELLSQSEQKSLIQLARHTLNDFVLKGVKDNFLEFKSSARLKRPSGAFVTLYKRQSPDAKRSLRGCIGYVFPVKSLEQTIMENTISAASMDPRFEPVSKEELEKLEIEITVLSPPRPVASYKDIRIGTDGILLKASGRQSVFLPHVATEYGWTIEETLRQLSQKAGLAPDAWQKNARFEVFQGQSIEEKEQLLD